LADRRGIFICHKKSTRLQPIGGFGCIVCESKKQAEKHRAGNAELSTSQSCHTGIRNGGSIMPGGNNNNELGDLYNYEDPMTPDRLQAIGKDLKLDVDPLPPENQKLRDRLYEGVSPSQYSACGIHGDRRVTVENVFRFYLMGTKGMDFKETGTILPGHPKFEEYVSEFQTFAKEHPVQGDNLAPEAKSQNTIAWAKIFLDCAEVMKSYRMPDIDYGDPAQVYEHRKDLSALTGGCIDFTQEFEYCLHMGDGDAVNKALGSEYINGQTNVWQKPQEFTRIYREAYHPQLPETGDASMLHSKMKGIASNRANFGESVNPYAGKTLEEIALDKTANRKPQDFAMANTSQIMYAMTYDPKYQHLTKDMTEKNALSYLQGKNQQFEQAHKALKSEAEKSLIKEYNSDLYLLHTKMEPTLQQGLMQGTAETYKQIFAQGMSPQQIYKKINSPEGSAVRENAHETFRQVFERGDYINYIKSIGIQNPMENVKIDGKTPAELWGGKYAFVTNPDEKTALYQAEVINEIYHGKSDVTLDAYLINEKGNVIKTSTPICRDDAPLAKEKAFFDEIDKLHESLLSAKNRLQATQSDKNANFEGKNAEGSEYYQNMTKALAKCLKLTDKNQKSNENFEDLTNALKEYQKAAATYERKRTGLFWAKRQNGIERKAVASEAAATLGDEIEKLQVLSKNVQIQPPSYVDPARRYSISNMRNEFEREVCVRVGRKPENLPPEIVSEQATLAQATVEKRNALRKRIGDMEANPSGTIETLDYSLGDSGITQKAKKYYKAVYDNQIKKADFAECQKLEQTFMTKEFEKKFHEDAQKLAQNQKFVKCTKDHPDTYVRDWYVSEKKAEKKQEKKLQEKIAEQTKKLNEKAEKAIEVLSDNMEVVYTPKAMQKAAALLYTKKLMDDGKLPAGAAPLEHATKLLENKAFLASLRQPDGRMLDKQEILKNVTGPDAVKITEQRMKEAAERIKENEKQRNKNTEANKSRNTGGKTF